MGRRLTWGQSGPFLATRVIREHALEGYVLPRESPLPATASGRLHPAFLARSAATARHEQGRAFSRNQRLRASQAALRRRHRLHAGGWRLHDRELRSRRGSCAGRCIIGWSPRRAMAACSPHSWRLKQTRGNYGRCSLNASSRSSACRRSWLRNALGQATSCSSARVAGSPNSRPQTRGARSFCTRSAAASLAALTGLPRTKPICFIGSSAGEPRKPVRTEPQGSYNLDARHQVGAAVG